MFSGETPRDGVSNEIIRVMIGMEKKSSQKNRDCDRLVT